MAKRLLLSGLLLFSFVTHAKKSYVVYYQDRPSVNGIKTLSTESERVVVDINKEDEEEFLSQLKSDDRVVLVEENTIFNHTWEPGDDNANNMDVYYTRQWSLEESPRGIQMPAAWDISRGSSSIVVAVLDTGILESDDFYRVLPGADLISNPLIANDGDARDMDPRDPGDWHKPNEYEFCNGYTEYSSWHGSHVAGIIGARANNGKGIVGVAPQVSILPVRVIGKCGGEMVDIADGIRWAVGGKVGNMPVNSNPAQIINLSLGARGTCSETIQNAIDFARSKGAVIVVSSGNSNVNMDYEPFTPATCRGVINTASSDQFATRSYFSNYGSQVDLVAPGGTGKYGLGILSFSNTGLKGPENNIVDRKDGTSMAAPHVSGAAALILSINPRLYPDQVEYILRETSESIIGMGTGSGLINVYEALKMAETVDPDSSFKAEEVYIERKPSNIYNGGDYYTRVDEQNSGGSCGTIDLQNGNGPGGGGNNPFFPTLLLGLVMAKMFRPRRA